MRLVNVYISTCPNDTFIFGHLIQKNIVDPFFQFRFSFYDIEELNQIALERPGSTIIKTSLPAYFQVKEFYEILECGGALGYKCGPVLVSYGENGYWDSIVVPGFHTTAYLLARFYLWKKGKKCRFSQMLFSRIPRAVMNREFDCGVLIHEGRFLYDSWRLKQIVDLGEFWEQNTGLPIPLGVILISKDLGPWKSRMEFLIRKSLTLANQNYSYLLPFIKELAQEEEEEVIWKHIETFVNQFTYDIGEEGRKAIDQLESVFRLFSNED